MNGCTVEDVEDGGEGKVVVIYMKGGEEERKIDSDLVIVADRPSSKIHQILQPGVERKYAGYGRRGTVHEKEISAKSKEALSDIPTLCSIGNSCTIVSVPPPFFPIIPAYSCPVTRFRSPTTLLCLAILSTNGFGTGTTLSTRKNTKQL